jgi:N-acetylglucosaminyldiphosphoundecaprenol N-acetyl-beta-D-mannosaminyltransferase
MLDHTGAASAGDATRRPFRLKRRAEERVELLGAVMDLVKAAEVFHFALAQIAAGKRAIIANHNLHSLYLLRKDPELRAFYRKADLVEVDSIPLILWARLVGQPSRRFHRCTYLDWRDEFWAWTQREQLRVFFVGGRPGVAERAIERVRGEWPGVEIGVHHGYFDMAPGAPESAAVVDKVRAFAPDVLLVGMGMPRQEVWIVRNLERLPTCATFTVGGAFDYEAGAQLPCPRWIGQLGAEWLFRMLTNPRLVGRYTLEPWRLVPSAIADLARALTRRRRADARAPIRRRSESLTG